MAQTHGVLVGQSRRLTAVFVRRACAGLEAGEQRILFNGVQLEDSQVLAEAGVSDDSTLMCLLRLLGGAKKRKKKTYTKPKKQKHKHKKIKLRVLKFYKVRAWPGLTGTGRNGRGAADYTQGWLRAPS